MILQGSTDFTSFNISPSEKLQNPSWKIPRALQERPAMPDHIPKDSDLIRSLIFAANIPFVSAGAGDDFSNNLFTDLVPVLALFGEQVVSPMEGAFII